DPRVRGTLGVSTTNRKRRKETLVEREQEYVGIDLHRRRSVIVRMNGAGTVLGVSKIDNDPLALSMAIAEAGPHPEVALEACYGWYWAADLLAADGAKVHLVHPLGLHWESRRVKNDVKDATELANRLRQHDLPEAWIAPGEVRELRELVRYRAKLVALRTSAKAQVHAVMAKLGILPPIGDMFGPGGQVLLDKMDFPGPYGLRVESLRDLLEVFDREIAMVERNIHQELKDHAGYRAIQALHGVGPVIASILVAEIGDVSRFESARHLCSWAGMTPKLYESDTKSYKGKITKQGSTIVRWVLVESVARYHGGAPIEPTYRRIAERRGGKIGNKIAKVAAARKLLTLVFYGLRDGEIRCLAREAA
ncbi:MAG TPA: IS110 family transposase, partial [Acidimicrobiales bacterium]|nr:IS110 family transposase [Acidimicrobiales bacterium]